MPTPTFTPRLGDDQRAAPRARPPARDFVYELGSDGVRIALGDLLLRIVPYGQIERVERGWAPGWQVGGPGMPFRGDEVRLRARSPFGLPWLSLTPPDPEGFVADLRVRLAARA
jgi:hypothetical protein